MSSRAGDAAALLLAELRGAYPRPFVDERAVLLAVSALNGSPAAAEGFLYELLIETGTVRAGHLHSVLDAWAFSGHPEDAERTYREFVVFVSPGARRETRVGLLHAFALAKDPERARAWYASFDDRSPSLLAALVAAHNCPGELTCLRGLRTVIEPPVREHPEIAEAFVHSFADAGDPETSEECFRVALRVIAESGPCQAMRRAIAASYFRLGRAADARRIMSERGRRAERAGGGRRP